MLVQLWRPTQAAVQVLAVMLGLVATTASYCDPLGSGMPPQAITGGGAAAAKH